MIAKSDSVVAQSVHRGDYGVRAGPAAVRAGADIAERGALQEVAIVEQQAVGGLGAGAGDQRGSAGQPVALHFGIAVIVVGRKMGVDISGFQHPQPDMIVRDGTIRGCGRVRPSVVRRGVIHV